MDFAELHLFRSSFLEVCTVIWLISWKTTNYLLGFLGVGKQRRTVAKFTQSVPSMRVDGLNHDFVFLFVRVSRLSA